MRKPLFTFFGLTLTFLLLLSGNLFAKDDIVISYGSRSKIVYHTKTGTYDVYAAGQRIITAAFCLAKNGDAELSSKNLSFAEHQSANISDGFGKGKKHVIRLVKPGSPELQQIFYTYPGRDYFFTELLMEGADLLSNYLSPLHAEVLDIFPRGVPKAIFVPFDNDTFIRYGLKVLQPGVTNVSSEVGVVFDEGSKRGLVTGSVEHTIWKTGVKSVGLAGKRSKIEVWGGYSDRDVTRDNIGHGSLNGDAIKSPRIFVGYFPDWKLGLEAYGKANRIHEPPYVFNWTKPAPFGWNSWGVIQTKLNYEKAVGVVDYFANEVPEFRNGGTAYIDLDSFWDNMTGGMRGDYTKLKQFADYCKSKGLEPGVYWAPFTDWGFGSGGDRTAEGSNYNFGEMWTKVKGGYHDFDGARALDPTHPGTMKRIDYIIDKLIACGFTMIKIDFLGHAAAESDDFYDKSVKTGMQAYRAGMEYLVRRLDGQMLIYAAISPSLATGRYAHIRRIACDAWKTIKDTEYTLNSVTYGWWQTYVYNFIDADHVVFGAESEGANRARFASAIITGTVITGDDFAQEGKWTATGKKLLQNKELLDIARVGRAFRPLDAGNGDTAAEIFTSQRKGCMYVAVFNYSGLEKKFFLSPGRLGLKRAKYEALRLLGPDDSAGAKVDLRGEAGGLEIMLPASDAAIFKVKILK